VRASPPTCILLLAVSRSCCGGLSIGHHATSCDLDQLPAVRPGRLSNGRLSKLDDEDVRRELIETRKSTGKSLLRGKHAGIAFNAHFIADSAIVCRRGEGIVSKASGVPVPERADCSGCARGHMRGRGGGVLAILLCVCQFVGGGVAAGFVAAEGWAAGASVLALKMIGRPSPPEPMTTIFVLGDCASRRVASMPRQRR
jgi:hypothetical protein